MIKSDLLSQGQEKALDTVVRGLDERFQGVFERETIEEVVLDSYIKRAANATV